MKADPPLIGRGPDIPVRVCVCVRVRVLLQSGREREVSNRDARSVANFSNFSDFSDPLATLFFPKKRLVTNLATSWTNYGESL